MRKISDKIKKSLESLSPKEKKIAIGVSIVFSLVSMMFLSYEMGGRKSVPLQKPAEQKAVVTLDRQLLEKSLYQEKERELRLRDEQIRELKVGIEEIKKERDKKDKAKPVRNYPPVPVPSPESERSENNESRTPYPPVPSLSAQQGIQKQVEPELAGKIEIFVNPNAGKIKAEQVADKKKEDVEKIYLPPSFMPAVLMTGVRAKTSGEGKGEPQPLLLRITDLAVLPNRIKKDLKDCFVIANAMGDLAQERADVRLVSMNCLARDGSVAIKQNIKGTVVDADGVLNLDGKVVARWGSTLAASMYSGFFAGLGDGLKAASSQTLITASGTLQQIKPGELLMGAAGSGVSSSFHKVADFMLDVAKQATPVVEVGNLKKVTVFITEGIDLEIKKYCSGLRSLGGAKCRDDI